MFRVAEREQALSEETNSVEPEQPSGDPEADAVSGVSVAPESKPESKPVGSGGILARFRAARERAQAFFARIGVFLRRSFSAAREAADRVRAALSYSWVQFVLYARSLQESSRSRFLTLSWVFFLLFLGTALLSAANPLRLLVPGLPFPAPARDTRPTVTLYSVLAADRKLAPIRRRIQMSADPAQLAKRLLFALTRPPAVQVQERDDFRDMIPLPGLGSSVRGIWARPSGQLVVDMRSSSLTDSLRKTAENRRPRRAEQDYMDAFVRSYARSIFEVLPSIRSIQFLIDGERQDWKGLSYDLRPPITRAWLDEAHEADPKAPGSRPR